VNGPNNKRVAIACQGGGSHTAFTAGVLKGLLRSVRLQEQYFFVSEPDINTGHNQRTLATSPATRGFPLPRG